MAHVDARELLAAGTDPLGTVIRLAESVPPGGVLTVDAPFDPMPLRSHLAAKGFSSTIGPAAGGGQRVTFTRDDLGIIEMARPAVEACGGVPQWEEDGRTHIDVRGLTPPLPMVIVLRTVRDLPPNARLVVHLDRDPLYLRPELAEIGWRATRLDGEEDEVVVLVERDA